MGECAGCTFYSGCIKRAASFLAALRFYSYLSASTGSKLAALFAGYIPKNSPTAVEKIVAKRTASRPITGLISALLAAAIWPTMAEMIQPNPGGELVNVVKHAPTSGVSKPPLMRRIVDTGVGVTVAVAVGLPVGVGVPFCKKMSTMREPELSP